MKRSLSFLSLLLCLSTVGSAAPQETSLDWLREHEDYLVKVSGDLLKLAEPAHHELRTSGYLQSELRRAGFEIKTGVAGLPTAFAASFGRGEPRIGIVTLLDALPGVAGGGAWHGCGHHLMGAADLGAALAVREEILARGLSGTVRFYGAPAEEIYHGGVYMVREGAFHDLDALLFWHPSSVTAVMGRSGLAMDSVRFVFHGKASDATDAREKGRSALAAAYDLAQRTALEEPPATVVNHVLLHGGEVPSVVPELATLWYFLHAKDRAEVEGLRMRIAGLAARSAEETGTRMEIQVLSSTRHWNVNRNLAEILHRNLGDDVLPLSFADEPIPISDDTAEASWVAPRGGFLVAAFPAGAPSHSREWEAAAATPLALAAVMRAARTLARTAIDLYTRPELLSAVREEFESSLQGEPYVSPLPAGRGPFDFLQPPEVSPR